MKNACIRAALALALVATLAGTLRAQTRCGGTERWQVKVGTDSSAHLVDVGTRVPIFLQELIGLPQPQLPPRHDNDTRLAEETRVYVVRGRLVKFKLESGRDGDRDYHLVVTDDTLQYSPPGHSFVAEIPKFECIPGQQGDPSVPSRFQNEIISARQKFESRFPNITGGWNQTGGIPVKVVGVAFFDRPHGQTGRAPNNIEIHPVLEIFFDEEAHEDAAAPSASPLLNPGFESGEQHWTATPGVIAGDGPEHAHSGSWKAWLGGYGVSHTDTLYQQIAIPASANSATLTFFLHISTQEQKNQVFDTLKLQIRDSSGTWLKTLATYTNLQAAPGFVPVTFDLSSYRGKTITIYFVAKEDSGSMTSFVLDDFNLTTQ